MKRNVLARCGLAGAVIIAALAMPSAPALADTGPSVLYHENFTGTDTPAGDWIAKSTGGGGRPCLTAATAPPTGGIPECLGVANGARKPDVAGSGAFQLTRNSREESGFGLFTRPLDTSKGIQVDFDYFQHDGRAYKDNDKFRARGGDGIAFFLINGAASPATAGDPGGSLGYRNLPGGLLAIGFDAFGNFSDPRWGGAGGPGETPNSVVLRGADSTGYRYIAGVKAPAWLAVDSAVQRARAKRHVTITVSTKNVLDVYVNFFNGKGSVRVLGPIDLNTIKGQPQLPPTIKFGFAAATGYATNFHEIQGMTVTGLPPDLRLAVSHAGMFKPGGTGSFQLAVSDDPAAGPTTGPATVVFHVPDGLTPGTPSGNGWQCSVSGQTVTCTRPGILPPGSSFPVVTVPVTVAPGAAGTLTATGVVSDPSDTGTPGKTVTDSVPVGALSPDLSITSTHSGSFQPGGTGSFVYTVSDSAKAGPTNGPVTVTVPVPTGMTPVSATGTGWSCSISGQTATCTRGDVLRPGASYPPLTVNVSVGQGTVGQLTTSASAATSADSSPQSATTSDTVTIVPPAPNLSIAVRGPGTVMAGSTGSFTMTVSNAANAGPTTGPVTATFNVPDGMTAQSVTGDGWACSVSGQTVTCTQPGSDADALDGGAKYPPVTVLVRVPATASGTVPASAAVGTAGDTGQPGETAQTSVTVTPLAPDLGVVITAPPVTAGDPATVTLVATDAPAAGPVTGTTTVTFPVPAGYTVTSASGDGWQCTRSVTCTRHDNLAPGDSFPPVTITLAVPAAANGQVPVGATAGTAGQAGVNSASGSLQINSVPPKLLLTIGDQGLFTAGKSGGAYVLDVSADATAGPVTGPVTVTFPLPGGMTAVSARGTGWNCAVAGSRVTCTRNDPLAPGGAYPTITVTTAVPATLAGSVTATGSASTGGVSASGSDTLKIGQLAPLVSVAVTPPAGLTAGGTGSYTLVASNAGSGGPTTGPMTVTFDVPSGASVTSASGAGWQCLVSGQTVTCTRGDILQPGASFPPVQIDVTVPATSGELTVTGSVSTPDNGAATGTQVTVQTPVTPLPPDLNAGVTATATAIAGTTDTTDVTVTAGTAGGPVTDPVTVTIPAPPGMTPGSASGDGWKCGDMEQDAGFVCVTAGVLDAGESYAPIDAQWNVNGGVTGTVPVHVTCYTADQANSGGAQGSAQVHVIAPPPDVTTQVVSSGAVAAGGTADLTVNVTDAVDSGPTTGDVSVTIPMPDQLHPRSVYGYGWDCSTFWQDVTCQRAAGGDELQPGSQYPPITVSGYAASSWAGTGVRATVGTS
jgi:hypothetical protein